MRVDYGNDDYQVPTSVVALAHATKVIEYGVVPFRYNERQDELMVLVPEDKPWEDRVLNDLCFKQPSRIIFKRANKKIVHELIELYYTKDSGLSLLIEQVTESGVVENQQVSVLIDCLLKAAWRRGVSDIHFDLSETECKIRFRQDGVLHVIGSISRHAWEIALNQIKIMCGMDITLRMSAQDGQCSKEIYSHKLDIRCSTLPAYYGEALVIRLLDKRRIKIGLSEIFHCQEQKAYLSKMTKYPHGLMLISGPTGSGKTTTLHALLQEMDSRSKNIISIEDPVEYKIENIRQINITNESQLQFSQAIKAVMRQDPDILMIGEIRDEETAKIALRASMTGHLVLASVHSQSAKSSLHRLNELGISYEQLKDNMRVVINQRLIRKICHYCRAYSGDDYSEVVCKHCYNTGYSGRSALMEMMPFSDCEDSDSEHVTLLSSARSALQKGITSKEEIYRVLGEVKI